jgi:flagellar hook assembly protein FlgD
MRGQKVATLLDRHVTAGDHSVRWDGRDSRGVNVGSGVYFCRVEADGFDDTTKIVLIR